MKRTERVGAIIKILSDSPNELFNLNYFCEKFGAAKSSISEDIQAADSAIRLVGTGYLETISGAKGGVKFIPDISDGDAIKLKEEFCKRLSEPSRFLGGNFIYTSDLFFDPILVTKMGSYFSKEFKDRNADYVVTLETKGVPLAFSVAKNLNLPLVVIRREAMISEGSTVSINYFSGSYDWMQKMSMSKRALKPNSNVLIIDDFMRCGGSVVGIAEMMKEFSCNVVGVGVAIASLYPEKKKIKDYFSLINIGEIDSDSKTLSLF